MDRLEENMKQIERERLHLRALVGMKSRNKGQVLTTNNQSIDTKVVCLHEQDQDEGMNMNVLLGEPQSKMVTGVDRQKRGRSVVSRARSLPLDQSIEGSASFGSSRSTEHEDNTSKSDRVLKTRSLDGLKVMDVELSDQGFGSEGSPLTNFNKRSSFQRGHRIRSHAKMLEIEETLNKIEVVKTSSSSVETYHRPESVIQVMTGSKSSNESYEMVKLTKMVSDSSSRVMGTRHIQTNSSGDRTSLILVAIVLTFLVCHSFRLLIQTYEVLNPSHSTPEHYDYCIKRDRYVEITFCRLHL